MRLFRKNRVEKFGQNTINNTDFSVLKPVTTTTKQKQ